MVKFTRTHMNMSFVSHLNLSKITTRQPLQKQILGDNLGFKGFSYDLLKKRKKNGLRFTKKSCRCNAVSGFAIRGEIMALMVPDGAARPHDAVLTYSGCQDPSNIVCCVLAYILFFAIQGSTRYLQRIPYSSCINTNAFVKLAMIAMISRYSTCYTVVTATTVFIFLKLLQVTLFLLHYISAIKYPFGALPRNITKYVKRNQVSLSKLHNTTSAAPNWRLIDEDALSAVDVYSIQGFCFSLGILLVWGVLCQLFFYVVRRVYCKNDKK